MIHRESWYREALELDLLRKKRDIKEDPEGYLRQLIRQGRPVTEFLNDYDWDTKDARRNLVQEFAKKGFLRGANLRDSQFYYAKIHSADLRDADLSRGSFEHADMEESNLQGVKALNANFSYAKLRGADFRGADLGGAHFRGAHLEEANLQGANVEGTDFRGAFYIQTQLEGTQGRYLGNEEHQGTEEEFGTFFRSYVQTALELIMEWGAYSEEGPEYDVGDFDEDQISPESLEEMRDDCRGFFNQAYSMIEGGLVQAGMDFFLTRNGHGAGFWDGRWGIYGDELTNLSKPYGSQDLRPEYTGDDGYGDPQWVLLV